MRTAFIAAVLVAGVCASLCAVEIKPRLKTPEQLRAILRIAHENEGTPLGDSLYSFGCTCIAADPCAEVETITFSSCADGPGCYACCNQQKTIWLDVCRLRYDYCIMGGDLCECYEEFDCCLECVERTHHQCQLACDS